MDCKHAQNMMSAYIDDALDAPTVLQLAMHLAACTDCADACKQMQNVRAAVKTHGIRYDAPDHLRQRIQNALQREQPRTRKLPKFSWAWINFGFATASSLAFAVMLGLYLAVPSDAERLDQEIVASHFRSLLADHLADVASSDQHTVKPWFTGKLDFSPPTYDLAAQGFALIGGRLDYLNQRPVAALAYRHRQHVLNLFIWPDKTKSSTPPTPSSRQGFQMVHWTQSGMHYWAISDMNRQDLLEFRRVLGLQLDKDNPQ
ncbi:anti-sigma factor family protein [Paraherbaspirillum soli]|uniref:Anti-sigma factor family protein n=1 Tax=Paraherbaspirillum soli TaxID=631222 RepID=A0ABW0M6W2_9BURK